MLLSITKKREVLLILSLRGYNVAHLLDPVAKKRLYFLAGTQPRRMLLKTALCDSGHEFQPPEERGGHRGPKVSHCQMV